MLSDETRPLLPLNSSELRWPKLEQDKRLSSNTPLLSNGQKTTAYARLWHSRIIRLAVLGVATILLSVLVWGPNRQEATLAVYHQPFEHGLLHYDLPPEIAHNLGPYAPRYNVTSFGEYPELDAQVPQGCSVTQVNILQRHGARYPVVGHGISIRQTLDKLKRVEQPTDAEFAFVPSYDFTFGANDLLPFGRKQSYLSGRAIAKKYHHLDLQSGIFIRSAAKGRILESSRWFKHGFSGGNFPAEMDELAWPDVAIPAGPHANNSLLVKNCRAASISDDLWEQLDNDLHSSRRSAPEEWLSIYGPPIAERLNAALPGAELTSEDVKNLMDVCGFETASNDGKPSPWCSLFAHEEWESYQYYWDLVRYWRQSHASLFAASQGSGWVNELLARLTETPVHFTGSINRTLDTDPATFPLPPHAPSIFADFSSDVTISHVVAALGILKDRHHLPPRGPIPKGRLFNSSKMTPFAGNLVVERLVCDQPPHDQALKTGDGPGKNIDKHETTFKGEAPSYHQAPSYVFVRMLFNDAVVPLHFDQCGEIGETQGLCELRKFVRTQEFSQSGGEWDERCGSDSLSNE